MKTKQILSGLKPTIRQTKIGLRLQCGECKTIRVFVIDANLKRVTDREAQHISIDTYCEICKHPFNAGIEWIETKFGYTATDQRIREIKELVIEDDLGMLPLHSDKN